MDGVPKILLSDWVRGKILYFVPHLSVRRS